MLYDFRMGDIEVLFASGVIHRSRLPCTDGSADCNSSRRYSALGRALRSIPGQQVGGILAIVTLDPESPTKIKAGVATFWVN